MLDIQKWKQASMEDLANNIPVVMMVAAMIAGVIAYLVYIVNGGYPAQIAAIKDMVYKYGYVYSRNNRSCFWRYCRKCYFITAGCGTCSSVT